MQQTIYAGEADLMSYEMLCGVDGINDHNQHCPRYSFIHQLRHNVKGKYYAILQTSGIFVPRQNTQL